MVALQILVLSVQVRILVSQPEQKASPKTGYFYFPSYHLFITKKAFFLPPWSEIRPLRLKSS